MSRVYAGVHEPRCNERCTADTHWLEGDDAPRVPKAIVGNVPATDCSDCGCTKDTPITTTYCSRCVAKRLGVTPEEALAMANAEHDIDYFYRQIAWHREQIAALEGSIRRAAED